MNSYFYIKYTLCPLAFPLLSIAHEAQQLIPALFYIGWISRIILMTSKNRYFIQHTAYSNNTFIIRQVLMIRYPNFSS